ncbi:MAG: transcription elongation factor Spt5 [Candidatus Aenigmarchaeota archaeon]|nr:transcription elongation factor Spt5 [Candidatus Aenigmarchaeota archaeon]
MEEGRIEEKSYEIYAVKTVVGREKVVLKVLAAKAKTNNLPIVAFAHPEELKGYIFVEGDFDAIKEVIKEVQHARGVLRKPIPIKDIERFLIPKKVEIELGIGDIVEVIGGPFKGEKGKVRKYDKTKREVTIELLEAAVPIPVTVSADLVRIVEKKSE